MKRIFPILFILVLASVVVTAQDEYSISKRRPVKFYEEARSEYASRNMEEARELLLKALNKEPEFMEAMLLLADLYHSQEQWEKEFDVLERSLEVDSTFYFPTYYNIGQAAYRSGKYNESLKYLKKYRDKSNNERARKKAESSIEHITFVRDAMNNQHDISLKSAGPNVNSEFDEYWPSLTADEQTMVITVLKPRDMSLYREKKGQLPKSSMFFQEDFYVSHADSSGRWQERTILPGKLNTHSNEGAQTLSADGNWMFFTSCGRSDSKGSCDIYFSRRTGDGWSAPANVGGPVNSSAWESQPHFSADGRTLYFISNREEGIGGKDIWKARVKGIKDDGTPYFGDLKNLGEPINTEGDENSPFLHHDGHTLYFSSNGHTGMGGMDLFMSRRNDQGVCSDPENLGYPINTDQGEIGLFVVARGNRAFFATNGQDEGMGGKDIYSFRLPREYRPDPVLYVKGKVFDRETREVLPADFELTNLETGKTVVTSQGTGFSGEFLVTLPMGGEYAFKADHPGYLFYSGNFNLTGDHPVDEPYYLEIGLEPIKKGATVRLENIFFETDSYDLKPESKVELNEVVEFMENNPDVRIMLEGHTDNVGSRKYNLELSKNRARTVYNYLVDQGIDPERMEYKGYGFSEPVETNETEEGRARNRRTEMRIL